MNIPVRLPNEWPISVVLDTDIGTDIDDTWALIMLLNLTEARLHSVNARGASSPRLPLIDLKLILTTFGNTEYRAKLVAQVLKSAGRLDVPIGIGSFSLLLLSVFSSGCFFLSGTKGKKADNVQQHERGERIRAAVQDFDLERDFVAHGGILYHDGIEAFLEIVKEHECSNKEPLTLLCIGPCTNIAEALRRDPRMSERINFVGMFGHLFPSSSASLSPSSSSTSDVVLPEYNVVKALEESKQVFNHHRWRSMTITPLDTCSHVRLKGELYQRIFSSLLHRSNEQLTKEDEGEGDRNKQVLQLLLEQYKVWLRDSNNEHVRKRYHFEEDEFLRQSSILFDTVAVLLCFSEAFLEMENSRLYVDDMGFTKVVCKEEEDAMMEEAKNVVRCATKWKDLDGYLEYLVRLLCKQGPFAYGDEEEERMIKKKESRL
ncbi:Nucleoside hydrolase [Balamuthia mandrillaris]